MGVNARLKAIYDRVPQPAQDLLVTLYSAKLHRQRYGGRFAEFQELMLRMETAGERAVADYQDAQLHRMVEHAYATVPSGVRELVISWLALYVWLEPSSSVSTVDPSRR